MSASTARKLAYVATTASLTAIGLYSASKRNKPQKNLLLANCKSVEQHVENLGVKEEERTVKKWDYNWDKMAPMKVDTKAVGEGSEGQTEANPTATRTLILIRHGQYIWDPNDPNKRILTELGKKQAAVTGKRLKELGHKYASIHYSTMPRALETSNIIRDCLPDVPASSCGLIREGAPIRPEPMQKTWKPESYEFFRDGPRIEAAFRRHFHRAPPSQTENSVEILVCHANVIRYFVCRALQLPPEAWLRISLAHGSLTTVVCRPNGTVSLKTLGSAEHLPPDMVTFR